MNLFGSDSMYNAGIAIEYDGKFKCIRVSYDKGNTIVQAVRKAIEKLVKSKLIDVNKIGTRYYLY